MVTDPAKSEPARVLLVDDDAELLELLAAVLRRAGYRVVAADTAEAALALVRDLGFDLAICDRHLPGMDGIELLEQLREQQPMCARVLLTGGLDLPTTLSAVNRGSVGRVLEKPVRGAALRTVVEDALQRRQRLVEAYGGLQRKTMQADRERLVEVIAGEHLRLALQPIVRAPDGAVYAYEALLRSTHVDFPGPLPLLAAAERHALLDVLADRVIDEALHWLQRDQSDARLFLNLHPTELATPDSLDRRLERLQPWASRVVLEVTERASISGAPTLERSMALIRERGFTVALDDLGAGYSALAMLAELQPGVIKVDMSIVRDCDSNPRKRRLLDLLCRFADATDALLVAEGVETQAEAETLRACGAHLLQGYLFGRPALMAAAVHPSARSLSSGAAGH
jgi:EAL domain-containing protein (putative c-di-GMP-specific phosphodiesterase class I)